jgi:hypothetical protein
VTSSLFNVSSLILVYLFYLFGWHDT